MRICKKECVYIYKSNWGCMYIYMYIHIYVYIYIYRYHIERQLHLHYLVFICETIRIYPYICHWYNSNAITITIVFVSIWHTFKGLKIIQVYIFFVFPCFWRKQIYWIKATPDLHDRLLYLLCRLEGAEDEHIYIHKYIPMCIYIHIYII